MSTPIVPISPTQRDTGGVVDSKPQCPPLAGVGAKIVAFASYLTGIAVLCLVGLDTVANNWAINNFVGNGYQFLTPLATASSTADLLRQYSFARGASLTDMSKVGQWVFNYTVMQLVTPDNDKVFLLSAGSFQTSATFDQCGFWKGVYAAPSLTVQLGGASDSISYLRGQAFSHTFTDDMTTNLGNASMSQSQLSALGYMPARLQVDVRLTVPVTLVNASRPQSMPVIYYRYFPRSYCTGCSPSATFGRGHCNLTFVYNASSASVRVTSGVFIDQTPYHLGLMLPQSIFTAASNYLKCIALLFAVGGYLASRRTVQWLEAAPGTIWDSMSCVRLRPVAFRTRRMHYALTCFRTIATSLSGCLRSRFSWTSTTPSCLSATSTSSTP